MVPVPSTYRHSSRLLYTLLSLAAHHVLPFFRAIWTHIDSDSSNPKTTSSSNADFSHAGHLSKREFTDHDQTIVFGLLIPVLVLLSGLFAGLTLGYMSLDETQLNVLSISGSEKQREYANKIKPIRENGHLLLVTLLLANMIVNETLPIIADPVLGGGVPSVVVSTALIVIFSEIIPQSLFTRHGLFLGAKMAGFTKILIYGLFVISWPVSRLLEWVLGPHHGIIYRRAELKELIAMHSSMATHGGDLKTDTVTIIGATLDLQEKVVRQAMTPIQDVFMLSIDAELDYELLKKICMTGHSRVPVFEEIEVPVHVPGHGHIAVVDGRGRARTQKVKKILGILLVKQCVLLDPQKSVPLRHLPLNKVFFVPQNESLLGILDRFQEGRSHMAIVSRFSREKAASVKKVVKHSLTQRLRERVLGDSSDSSDDEKETEKEKKKVRRRPERKIKDIEEGTEDGEATLKGERTDEFPSSRSASRSNESADRGITELTVADFQKRPREVHDVGREKGEHAAVTGNSGESKSRRPSFQLSRAAAGMASISNLEQSMPADAVLAPGLAEEFLQGFDPAINPLGIITLEDVLEELIGEEIFDEFDSEGAHGDPYLPPAEAAESFEAVGVPPQVMPNPKPAPLSLKPPSLKGKGFNFLRSRSAPPSPRDSIADIHSSAPNTANESNPPALPRTQSQSNVERSGMSTTVATTEERNAFIRGRPPVIVEQYSSGSNTSATSPEEPGLLQTAAQEVTGTAEKVPVVQPTPMPMAKVPHVAQLAPPVSRSASPAPSLEAILLERKRRIGTSGAGTTPATGSLGINASLTAPVASSTIGAAILRPASSSKGTRFKSTPISNTSVNLPVGISPDVGRPQDEAGAERDRSNPSGANDESRIPSGKDKEGPDKQTDDMNERSAKSSRFMIQ